MLRLIWNTLTVVSSMTVTPVIDPHRLTPWDSKNVWVTLAKAINQTSFCVSLALPEQPFHTCFVGVPLKNSAVVLQGVNSSRSATRNRACNTTESGGRLCSTTEQCVENWDKWKDLLPKATQ